MKFFSKFKIDILFFALIAIIFFGLRLPNLTLQPIFADEAIYIRWAQVMKSEPTLRFVSLSDGKTPLFMWSMTPLFKVFRDPLMAGRFLSVLSGFMTLTGVFFLSRMVFGRSVSFWAALLYAISPYTVFFDRLALTDSMLTGFTVWIIYFAVRLIKTLRLDLAMILGYFIGGALLVKTPAMVNILVLPLSIIGLAKNNYARSRLLKLLLYWGIAIIIAMAIYNILRLGPGFQQLSSRNADYMFSPFELKDRPLDPFIPHLRDMADWFPKLLTAPILAVLAIGVFVTISTFNRLALIILIWALIPLILEMAFLKTFTARYLLPSIPPLLIISALGIDYILKKIKLNKVSAMVLALIVVLPMSLYFDYWLFTDPAKAPLPKEERKGYLEDWTAGYGFKEIAQYVLDKSKTQSVVVGTEGFFGTLPDGLQIYLDKSNVPIIGGPGLITPPVRNATKNNLTFYVGNKNRIEGSLQGVNLVKQFPKAKPLDGSPQDAMMLYQVLPQ